MRRREAWYIGWMGRGAGNGRREPQAMMALAAVVMMFGAVACRHKHAAPTSAYLTEVEKLRSERLASLTRDDGWLTLIGISWLKPGINRLGSAGDNDIVVCGKAVPASIGTLELRSDGAVLLHAEATAAVTSGGVPVTEMKLRTDRGGRPDVLSVGSIRMNVIDRSGAMALRVRDPDSPRRTAFKGIEYFPVDPEMRVVASYERYPTPREVAVASAQGPSQKMLVPGLLRFRIRGRAANLEPFVSAPTDRSLFIVFSDATAGHETYGAGRFLDADAPADGTTSVTLDFNLAYNPPCAFTPYATCPLPPRGNVLTFPVAAGEKVPSGH
jgi:uncharacterized protein